LLVSIIPDLLIRHSGQVHARQHDDRSVRWPNESAGGQSSECGEGPGSFERHDIPAGAIEEARDHGGAGQGLHPDRHPEPNRLSTWCGALLKLSTAHLYTYLNWLRAKRELNYNVMKLYLIRVKLFMHKMTSGQQISGALLKLRWLERYSSIGII